MLSAIAGSMMRRRRGHQVERRQRQRDAVADGEERDDLQQRRPAAAEQQQPDEEQDVVGTDQDVMDARRRERAHHRQRTLRGARVVDVFLAVGVEDQLLLQRAVLVDVDERLVQRVVGKQVGVERQGAGILVGDAVLQPQRRVVAQHLETGPLQVEAPVAAQHQPRLEEGAEPLAGLFRDRVLEQPLRRADAELVRRVDDVDDQRAVDAAVAEHDVEIAERRRVRGRAALGGRQHQRGQREPPGGAADTGHEPDDFSSRRHAVTGRPARPSSPWWNGSS